MLQWVLAQKTGQMRSMFQNFHSNYIVSSIVANFFALQDASWQVDRIWSPFVENSPHAVLDLKRSYLVFLLFSQYIPCLLYHFENTFLSGSFILTISGAVKP